MLWACHTCARRFHRPQEAIQSAVVAALCRRSPKPGGLAAPNPRRGIRSLMQHRNIMNKPSRRTPVLTMLTWAAVTLAAVAREPVLRSDANVMVELSFTASRAYSDPFNEVTLDVIFIG